MKPIRLRKRIGFTTLGLRLIYYFLYPFFHCRAPLTEELKQSDEPVVFVPNHYNIFGPISFLHSVALNYSTWMSEEIITPETAVKHVEPGIRQFFPFLGDRAIAWLCKRAAFLTCSIQTRFSPIPVDRDRPSTLLTTMRQSIAALNRGESLLIFPETGLPQYSVTSVTPFFPGFATIGQIYYRKTGRNLRFIPCYIDAQHRVIRFGEPVVYQPDRAAADESERVSEELNRRVRSMAAASRGETEEKSNPRSRSLLHLCNGARLGLLIPLFLLLTRGEATPAGVLYLAGEALRILFHYIASRSFVSTSGLPFLLSRIITCAANTCSVLYLHATRLTSVWLPGAVLLHSMAMLLVPLLSRLFRHGWAGSTHADRVAAGWLGFFCTLGLLLPGPAASMLPWLSLPVLLLLFVSVCKSFCFQKRILLVEEGSVTSPESAG